MREIHGDFILRNKHIYIYIYKKIESTLSKLNFNRQPRTIHIFYFIYEIGYDILQTCAHVCKISHFIDSKKVCCKVKWDPTYKYFVLLKLLTKSLVIGLLSGPYFSIQRQFFMACSHNAPCNHVHWNWI